MKHHQCQGGWAEMCPHQVFLPRKNVVVIVVKRLISELGQNDNMASVTQEKQLHVSSCNLFSPLPNEVSKAPAGGLLDFFKMVERSLVLYNGAQSQFKINIIPVEFTEHSIDFISLIKL